MTGYHLSQNHALKLVLINSFEFFVIYNTVFHNTAVLGGKHGPNSCVVSGRRIFGWAKVVGLVRKTRVRGQRRVAGMFTFAMAAYNLVRMRKLPMVAA